MLNLKRALILLAVLALCVAVPAFAAPTAPVGSVLSVGTGGGPQVGVYPDGRFVVVWNAPSPATLFARFFDPNGVATSGAIQLLRPAGQILDSVATLPTGGFVAVWDQKDASGIYRVLARVFDLAGVPVSAPFKVHGNSPYVRCCAVVATAPDGGFAVEWTAYAGNLGEFNTYATLLNRFFDRTGHPLGAPPADPVLQPLPDLGRAFVDTVVVTPQGAFSDVWLDEADDVNLQWSRRGKPGFPGGYGGFQTSARDDANNYGADLATTAAVIQPGGGFVLAWASGLQDFPGASPVSSIFTQRFDALGNAIGRSPGKASLESSWAIEPHLANLPDGGFVTIWTQAPSRASFDGVLHGRTFSAAGRPSTAEYRLGTVPAGNQYQAVLASGANGQVVAAWSQVDTKGILRVYARILRPTQ